MFIDEPPFYAVGDPDYASLSDVDEAVMLRMLKTYKELATQRYNAPSLAYSDFNGPNNFRKSSSYNTLKRLAGKLVEAKVEDPGHFISFIFEWWVSPRHHDYQVRKLQEAGVFGAKGSGVRYPSLTYIIRNGDELLEMFIAIPNYKPSQFIPADDLAKFHREVMRRKVERWCLASGKTPTDYWLTPYHLFPPYLDWRWVDYSESLWECDALIQEKRGFSVGELKEFLVELERATEEYHRQHPSVPPFVTKVEWEEPNEVDQERIDRYQEAINQGVDVLSEDFQKGVEDEINPIDTEHPDTIAWYFFGIGQPRYRDGEEIDVDEPIGTFKR